MLDNSMSTTQHPMAISDRIDTYMVDCMSLPASLERRSRGLVLKSYIHPLARSPIAAGINWATACIAKQKRPAKLENARKEDDTEWKDAIKKLEHIWDDCRHETRAKMNKILKDLDDVKEELDELLDCIKRITKAVEARAKPI